MEKKINALNVTAQLSHRAAGNSSLTLPIDAVSNCFPGLEYDFRNIWRHIFEGIVLHEATNYVVDADPEYKHLIGHWLLFVENDPMITQVFGPTEGNPENSVLAVTNLEWSNALASKLQTPGAEFTVYFSKDARAEQVEWSDDFKADAITEKLVIRSLFAEVTQGKFQGEPTGMLSEKIVQPGDLTQSLCSPWQNDYRECACYYWAASRPDYVNVDAGPDGLSRGDNWMQKERPDPEDKNYVLDDRKKSELFSYEDLFGEWQNLLKFQIQGKDYE